jgi:hypothetical protein
LVGVYPEIFGSGGSADHAAPFHRPMRASGLPPIDVNHPPTKSA